MARVEVKDKRAALGAMLADVREHPPTVMVPAHGDMATSVVVCICVAATRRTALTPLPIWRTAEALLHVADFARELGLGGHHRAMLEARWEGLRGRELSSWPDKPARRLGEWTSEASASARLTFELAELPEGLEALVEGLVGPLYELFSRGARPDPEFVAAHIQRLLTRS